jgi:coatomer subunit epsilon
MATNLLYSVYLTVQIYLSIARADLAKKIYLAAKKAQSTIKNNSSNLNNDLLLQLTEASLGLVSGGSLLDTAYHIYDEAASSPGSSTNGGIIAKKGVTYLMRGHLAEAEASFDEALSLTSGAPASSGLSGDALVGKTIMKLLSGKAADADAAYE